MTEQEGVEMGLRRLARATTLGAIATVLMTATAVAGPPRVEDGYYNGQTVQFIQPAVFSAKPNGGTFACFGLGPDLTRTSRSAVTPTLFVILNDFATQDHCDGDATALRHDHVLSTEPGQADYTGSWKLVLAVPGPSFDPSDMPFTSVAEVQAGVASGELVLVDPGVTMIAPVVGGPS
jgi:hypothetical protein